VLTQLVGSDGIGRVWDVALAPHHWHWQTRRLSLISDYCRGGARSVQRVPDRRMRLRCISESGACPGPETL